MFVEFQMIIPERQSFVYDNSEVEEGEDDGVVQLHPQLEEATTPTTINSDLVRNFYARKRRSDGTHPAGTRITFLNGSGVAVAELYDTVKAKLSGN